MKSRDRDCALVADRERREDSCGGPAIGARDADDLRPAVLAELEKELRAAVDLTLREMESWKAAGFSLDEAWQASREHYLILREEPDENEEPMPPNPAYDAIVAINRIPLDEEED